MKPVWRSTRPAVACWPMRCTVRWSCMRSMAAWCPSWPRATMSSAGCRWCATSCTRRASGQPSSMQWPTPAGRGWPARCSPVRWPPDHSPGRLAVPALGVHHMEAHVLAPMLEERVPDFPFLCLLVSGGHTQLVRVDAIGQYRLLGESIDDAAGEAFDKTAKMLALPYPGGPHLARLAESGDATSRPAATSDARSSRDWTSASAGLKTAAIMRWTAYRHQATSDASGGMWWRIRPLPSMTKSEGCMQATRAVGRGPCRIVRSGGRRHAAWQVRARAGSGRPVSGW